MPEQEQPDSQRDLLIGKWTWTDGRVGTSEFRSDGTFEERYRETVPDMKVGEAIDPENQKLVERDSKIMGQYQFHVFNSEPFILVRSLGRADRSLAIVVTDNELTLKHNSSGEVHRMTRMPRDLAKALIGAWESTLTDVGEGKTFRTDGTVEILRANGDVIVGQYKWQDAENIVMRFPSTVNRYRVVIGGDNLTLLDESGAVHRMTRSK